MDWHKLQHTLYNLDPTDPKEDFAKLREQANGNSSNDIPPTKNYVSESASISEGTLPVNIDSIDEFAALAGIPITEGKQKTGSAGQAKGKDPMPKAKAGRTDHPLKNKLVGEGPLDGFAKGFQASQKGGALGPDAAERAAGKIINKVTNPMSKKSPKSGNKNNKTKSDSASAPSMRIATALGTSNTTLLNQAIQRLQKGQPLARNHYAPLEEAFKNILSMNRKELQRLTTILAQGKTSESVEEAKKSNATQERNPHSQDLQALRRSGAMGAHKDKKKQLPRKQKHKNKMATESIKDELYRRLNEKK